VTKDFSLNFNGVQTRVVGIPFEVSKDTLVTTIEISAQGEK